MTVDRHDSNQLNPEVPFGYVSPDLKAYFRTVDDQLKEWQQNWDHAGREEDVDPDESTPCFFSLFLIFGEVGQLNPWTRERPVVCRQENFLDGRSARDIWQGARARN